MKTVIQRVSEAEVRVEGQTIARIGTGLLLLIGIEESDGTEDIDWLVSKICNLRIFNDANGVMNLSLADVGGDIIIVSQFTLQAAVKKGNRPSYIAAARPETAIPIYEAFVQKASQTLGKPVQTGQFGADMKVSLINDGPVTICIDSKNRI